MPDALEADEMGLGKTFTLVAAATICKLLTETVVMGLHLSILWGNTLPNSVNMIQNEFPVIPGEERECYPLQRPNSVPRHLIEIRKCTLSQHPVLSSAHEPILIVRILGVAEMFKRVIDEVIFATALEFMKLLQAEDPNLTHKDLNTTVDEP
jgi:hypothetical protein